MDYKCSLLQKGGIHKGCLRKDGLMQKGGAGEGAEGTIFSESWTFVDYRSLLV